MKRGPGLARCVVLVAAVFNTANALRADEDGGLFPEGWRILSASAVTGFVTQAAVRDDLKLTDEQQQRIGQLRDDLLAVRKAEGVDVNRLVEGRGRGGDEAETALAEILTPEQRRRHLQLTLQQLLISGRGIAAIQEITELNDAAGLTPEQVEQIETIQDEISAATIERIRTNRPERNGLFMNLDVTNRVMEINELSEQENQRVAAVLNNDQKKRLLERLGPPLTGRLNAVPLSAPRRQLQPFAGVRRIPRLPMPMMPRRITAPGPAPSLGRTALSESSLNAALLAINDIRDELNVAPERVQEEVLLGGDAAELTRCVKNLERWLKPGQLARLRELALQLALERNGPAAVLEYREVVDALQLADEQRSILAPLVQQELNSNRQALLLSVEPDSAKRRGLEKELAERIRGVLNESQRERLAAFLGKPYRGTLSLAAIEQALHPRLSARARTTTALGRMIIRNPLSMSLAPIHDELQLTEDQRKAIGNGIAFIQNRDKLEQILTEAQLKRLDQIMLQGEARRDGPAAIFHSRSVIDTLAPTEDQQKRLLEIIQEDTRSYLRIPRDKLAEALPELDSATATKLEAVLTDEQRGKLAGLLGEPADCLDEPARPARLP